MTDLGLHRCCRPRAWGLLACVGLLAIGACQRQAPPEPSARNKLKQELKPDFEPQKFVSRPNDSVHTEMLLKPGHWSSIDLDVVANRDDARGQLVSQLLDEAGTPLDQVLTPFRAQFERPVTLPKTQLRRVESSLFCPEYNAPAAAVDRLFDERGSERFDARAAVKLLPAHQWFFVVLARDPDRYRYLPDLDCVLAPNGQSYADESVPDYRVRMFARGRQVELASSFAGWTSTAYVLWDDRDPSDLSPDQQQAMLDWLHWGGQLIVSGPETLATLRGSFLDSVLPATAGGVREINSEAFAALANVTPYEPMRLARPYSGVELIAKAGATCPIKLQQFDRPPLLLERRVGRGRVVVTAFGLGDRKLTDWRGLDAFYNACLLQRPARDYDDSIPGVSLAVHWADQKSGAEPDPARTTGVRYASRDFGIGTLRGVTDYQLGINSLGQIGVQQSTQSDSSPVEWMRLHGHWPTQAPKPDSALALPKVAGWSDLSPISNAAREALRAAAEIPVPPARFVFWALAAYLAVLVPLNWIAFRLLGRVEWAWAAAPVIAAAGTAAVVWSTQLNIGFSRARSEIGIIEMQPGYERSHLTRYTAIYNSLGAAYRLRFDDPSAVALPFFTGANVLPSQERQTVSLRRMPALADHEQLGAVSLDNFQIASNSTGMVHSEQMLPATGSLRLVRLADHRARIENHTPWTITRPAIVSGKRVIPIQTLEPEGQCELSLTGGVAIVDPKWLVQAAEGLDLRNLVLTAAITVDEGQHCLVGVVAGPVAGMETEPAAVPAHIANVLFAHLDYGPLAQPQRDANRAPVTKVIEGSE